MSPLPAPARTGAGPRRWDEFLDNIAGERLFGETSDKKPVRLVATPDHG